MSMTDQRGIVADWLVKLVIGFAIFGVIAFDAGSILVNYFTLDSGADDVAKSISVTVAGTAGQSISVTDQEVVAMATEEVGAEEGGVDGARVLKKGTHIDEEGVIHVQLRRTASTLLVKRIAAIAKWARATAEGQAGTG